MINMNKKLLAILLVCALLVGAGATLVMLNMGIGDARLISSGEYTQAQEFIDRYKKLDNLLAIVESEYYTDVDREKLLEGAYKGLVEGLGDKYSEYVTSSEADDFTNSITGEFYGIGVSFFINDQGYVEIDTVHMDGPAEKGGLLSGDLIVKVDGESIVGLSSTEAQKHIRGEKDSKVEIGYLRNGAEYSTLLTRAKISELTVASAIQPDGIGYIRISSFGNDTGKEFKKNLEKMENEGAVALIIDLRNNGGGLVDSAVEVADCLMNKGTVAYALAKNGTRENYTVSDGRTALPYALLVNERTASASEILTIGIKDNKEGIVVGKNTYGKGIIQGSMTLPDGSMLKITFMEYYSPSGETIHSVGVAPDYEVDLPYNATDDYQYNKAAELLLSEVK